MLRDIIKLFYHRYCPTKIFLKTYYYRVFHKKLDLRDHKTFNEKLQWLKIYDKKPIYTTLVDKYEVKKYVANLIGDEYIIPTLGVWDHFDEINFDELPSQFVLKCTHDSGGIVIVNDKNTFDKQAARVKLEQSLRRNFYHVAREWPYKNVKPRIIAEEYMVDQDKAELPDYKLFTFNGKVKLIQYDYERFTNHKRKFYDEKWKFIDTVLTYPNEPSETKDCPDALEEMEKLAEILSRNITFLRTDFYCISGKVYFGELTLYPGGGFEKFQDDKFDEKLGSFLELPISVR